MRPNTNGRRRDPIVVIARYQREHCPRCSGTGIQKFPAAIYVGGKLQRSWEYEAECPWCVGAMFFLTGAAS